METFNLFTIHLFSGFVVSVALVAFALVVGPEKLTQEFCFDIEALYHGSILGAYSLA